METNALPEYRADDNPTGCCPRFDPEGWDAQELHFRDKLFLRVTTRSENHVPIDMGPVFEDTFTAMFEAGAYDSKDIIVLSRDLSPSEAEHFFGQGCGAFDRRLSDEGVRRTVFRGTAMGEAGARRGQGAEWRRRQGLLFLYDLPEMRRFLWQELRRRHRSGALVM